jgi:NAD(P)-dependent dehydrogenase (short-subunit alcohol dehydrogenase family)
MKNEKFVIVTGATRGLGLGCVETLLKQGHRVLATGRDPQKIRQALPAELHEKLLVEALDVASPASLDAFATRLSVLTDKVDVLINNAGIFVDDYSAKGPLGTPLEALERTLRTNLMGPYRLCQIVFPFLKRSTEGRIVNVSSGMGQLSEMGGGTPAYRISKTALNGLTALLANELKSDKILVNSVCPGWVKTDMGGAGATRELSQGVASILWAAEVPSGGPTGGFFRDGKALAW